MRSTPLAAMECLLDIPPIDIYAEGIALKFMYRLQRAGDWVPSMGQGILLTKTHINLCTRLSLGIPEMDMPCDLVTEFLPDLRQFKVEFRSRRMAPGRTAGRALLSI